MRQSNLSSLRTSLLPFMDFLIYHIADKLQRMMKIVSEKCHRGRRTNVKPFDDQIRFIETWGLVLEVF